MYAPDAPRVWFVAALLAAACDEGGATTQEDDASPVGGKADVIDADDGGMRPTDSREYKVMLDPAAFAGDDPAYAVAAFWGDLESVAHDLGGKGEGPFDKVRDREIAFFDVPVSCALRAGGFSLRRRVEDDEGEVTLKLRSPDRLLAATTEVEPKTSDFEQKLEEDVVPPFVSNHSLSFTFEVEPDWSPASMTDLFELVEAQGLETIAGPLVVVGDTVYRERAYKGAEIDLGAADADVTVTLWWLPGESEGPVVAEASFTIEAGDGFENDVVRRANLVFDALAGLEPWAAPDATTKTALVYERAAGLCDDGTD